MINHKKRKASETLRGYPISLFTIFPYLSTLKMPVLQAVILSLWNVKI
nr:MAG TPA: hypothetical protein [Caudoviricetes sp.]